MGRRPASIPLLAALLLGVVARSAGAQTTAIGDLRQLGRLEQESVGDALANLHVAVDPSPTGKTIGRIFVVNLPVFSQRDWYFQLFNIFHWTTRPYILQRELLMKPGQLYDQALVEESTRNIQNPPPIILGNRSLGQPELSSVVVILPIVSPVPGQVDLLLVTRDVWSLRFNSNFEYQGNALTLLETSLSENNLFGWRKYVSVTFNMDQGRYYYGPIYYDPNIHGTRLTLWTQALFYNSRETGNYEGNSQIVSIRYPLYSLATPWGAGVDVTHSSTVLRSFRGNAVRLVDVAGTPDLLPYEYRRRAVGVDANGIRSFGGPIIQRASLGYLVDRRRAEVLPDFPGDATQAALFLQQWTPTNEQRSEPYMRYEMFTPRYAIIRDLDTFDLRENRQLGPYFRARVSEGVPELGASFRALGLSVAAGFAAAPAGGYGSVAVAASARLRHGDSQWIDQTGTAEIFVASPLMGRQFRIVVGAETASKLNDTTHTPYTLGGSNGLRGYQIGEFLGTTALVGHIEIRTAPLAILSQRFGGVAFYDIGDAGPSYADLVPRNDVGVGLRWLIPQFNSSVLRFDWAVPLQDGTVTRAGMPGRFTAGYTQAFDTGHAFF